jgi:hypothetical protein
MHVRPNPYAKMPFDVDVKSPKNPKWFYWGSAKTIKQAKKMIDENLKKHLGVGSTARIVESKTAKILWDIEAV